MVVEVAVYMLRATGQDGGLAAAAREQQTVALVVQVCQIPAAEVVDKATRLLRLAAQAVVGV